MRISIDDRWRVRAESSLEVPLSATAAWGQMRDWRRFLTIDPLHERLDDVRPPQHSGPAGTTFLIRHRFMGIGPTRLGRMLSWNEGRGYAISDISSRGRRVGFPHVCTYGVEGAGEGRSRVVLGARGVWTARWWPRWMVRAWLGWVLLATEARVRAEFERVVVWRGRRAE